MDHAGLLQADFAHLLNHGFCAADRCRGWQRHHRYQIALVLRRHQAGRRLDEAEASQQHQAGVDHQADRAHAQQPFHAALIAVAGGQESAIERAEQPAQRTIDQALDTIRLFIMRTQQQCRQRWRQRQRIKGRDQRGEGDRQGELPIELPVEAADQGWRNEHRAQHQRDRDDGAADLVHRAVCGLAWRAPFLDRAFHVFDDHDRVIHDNADGEHQREQRERVQRKAEHLQCRQRADDRHRHGDDRNQRGAPALQEQQHYQHDQGHRFEQGVNHGADRFGHELRGVVDDRIVHAIGKVLLQFDHALAHRVGQFQRVGTRLQKHRHGHGGLVVEPALQRIVTSAEFDACHVAKARQLAARAGLDDDLLELAFAAESSLGIDRQLEVGALAERSAADRAGRHLQVLFAHRRDHVAGREPARGQLLRVQPHAHRVVAGAEQAHIAGARQAREFVTDLDQRVVAQIQTVIATVR